MNNAFNDIFTIKINGNGELRITQTSTNWVNLFQFLKARGYRATRVDNKRVYYLRWNYQVRIVSAWEIRDDFHQMLKDGTENLRIPSDLDSVTIMDWVYRKNLIKPKHLSFCLDEDLSEKEIRQYQMR